MADDTAAAMSIRRRRAIVVAASIAIAVALGLLLAWASRGHFAGRYALPVAGHEPSVTVQRDTLPPPVGKPAPRIAPPTAVAAPPPAEIGEAASDEDDRARIADAVGRATAKALRRGETVRWHKAGRSGYVMVSEARDDGGRLCRNVSATVIAGAGQTQSAAHLWCQHEDGGDWEPAR